MRHLSLSGLTCKWSSSFPFTASSDRMSRGGGTVRLDGQSASKASLANLHPMSYSQQLLTVVSLANLLHPNFFPKSSSDWVAWAWQNHRIGCKKKKQKAAKEIGCKKELQTKPLQSQGTTESGPCPLGFISIKRHLRGAMLRGKPSSDLAKNPPCSCFLCPGLRKPSS